VTSTRDSGWAFHAIGRVCSPLKEKFGLPRQAVLVPELKVHIDILPPYDREEAFKGLEGYSHIWLVGVFHLAQREQWQATVRPPRLGGNVRVGVFASRAPYRPNPIALSLCALNGIRRHEGRLQLSVTGCDLVDGTPVLDIKPYLPYADNLPKARNGFAPGPPPKTKPVSFSDQAVRTCRLLEAQSYPRLERLIADLLALDPRPGYAPGSEKRCFGMRLWDLNIRFEVHDDHIAVRAIEQP
jgi:tRNA-Thr(GGU) m(6)t(6)A37 methyltransferase TsaA